MEMGLGMHELAKNPEKDYRIDSNG